MNQSLQCPKCKTRFRWTEIDSGLSSVNCPACKQTVKILDADTNLASEPLADNNFVDHVVIEGFRIEGVLGRGGMGVVCAARQTDLFNRRVAIKILNPALASDRQLVQRFELEATALARLSHPNIVNIYQQGKTADGLPYFVMEYVTAFNDGPSTDLRGLISTGCLPAEDVKHYAIQIDHPRSAALRSRCYTLSGLIAVP